METSNDLILRNREKQRRYYLKNKDKINARQRANQKKNTEYAFLWSLKNEYGITKERFDELVIEQCGKCATCNKQLTKFHIDHDHKTGKVRGLLCGPCNQAIGLVKESSQTLANIINYLKERV